MYIFTALLQSYIPLQFFKLVILSAILMHIFHVVHVFFVVQVNYVPPKIYFIKSKPICISYHKAILLDDHWDHIFKIYDFTYAQKKEKLTNFFFSSSLNASKIACRLRWSK